MPISIKQIVRWFVAVVFAIGTTAQAQPATTQELDWQPEWRRYGPVNAVVTGLAASAAIGTQLYWREPDSARWTGPLPGDSIARAAFLVSGSERRKAASRVSDFLLYGLLAMPTVVDPGVAWVSRESPDAAGQMAAISLQSIALTYMTVNILKRAVARRRPGFGSCYDSEHSAKSCRARPNVSFPSGHTATAFVGASLICAMHRQMDIYQAGRWHRLPCIAGMSAATAVAYLRIASNNHFLTDTLVGAAIGFSAGYLLPHALFFGFDEHAESDATANQTLNLPRPGSAPSTRGLQFRIRF